MMSAYFINRILFITGFVFSLNNITIAQSIDDDSTRYAGPSVCECVKYAKEDIQLQSQCNQKYNYNNMSTYQKHAFEEKIRACSDPAVCDCIERGPFDKELQKVCDQKFDEANMTVEELKAYTSDKETCYVPSQTRPGLKRICQCVNYETEEERELNCEGIWEISNLTQAERKAFVDDITRCIENKNDPDFTLTLCDCMNVPDDDLELKERCINKFDLNNMLEEDIAGHRKKMGDCSIQEGDELTIVCNCLKEEQTTGKMSSACIKTLQALEKKYKNKTPEEMEGFFQKLLECMGIDKSKY